MQAKDIPELPVLAFIAASPRWCTLFVGFENSVANAMPARTPPKVMRAKMQSLIKRGLVTGCTCGCRGEFEITDKGRTLLSPLLQ